MTAFDAHLRPAGEVSAWDTAVAMMRARPGVLVAAIVAAAVIVCLALFALVAGQELRFRATQAVDEVKGSVFLRPQTSRAAAEALKGQLEALPFIRDASLRTKESAIVALEAGGLPQANRANPLPDVWVVTLKLSQAEEGARPLSDRLTEARGSLARLPDVESVDIDDAWLATLDRWQSFAATAVRGGSAALFALVWLLLGCVFFLAGRGIAGSLSRPGLGEADGGWSAAIVGIVVGSATLLASAALVAAATFGAQSFGMDWKPMAARVGQMSGTSAAALGASVLLLASIIIGTAARRR